MAFPKPRTPIINWNHPLSKGLVFDGALFEGGGLKALDISKSSVGTIVGATWSKDVFGNIMNFSGATDRIAYATNPIQDSVIPPVSIECLIKVAGAGGGNLGRICHKKSGTTQYFAILMSSSTTVIGFNLNTSGTGGTWNFDMLNTNWHHCVFAYDGGSSGNVGTKGNSCRCWFDGTERNLQGFTAPTGTIVTDDANFYIGNRSDNARNFNGKIAYVRYWKRLLVDQDAKSLYTNPWQIYQRPRINIGNTISDTVVRYWRTLMGVGV